MNIKYSFIEIFELSDCKAQTITDTISSACANLGLAMRKRCVVSEVMILGSPALRMKRASDPKGFHMIKQ